MVRQQKSPFDVLGTHPYPQQEWRCAFVAEWARLAEGCADVTQTAEAAAELYARYGARNPTEVAREEWGGPTQAPLDAGDSPTDADGGVW